MKENRPRVNSKRNRRAARAEMKRALSAEEIFHYSIVAEISGAPFVAERLRSLRGAVTAEEVVSLLQLATLEAEARRGGRRD